MNGFRAVSFLSICILGCGCAQPVAENGERRAVDLTEIDSRHRLVRKRTETKFAQAAFLSPDPDSDVDVPLSMAPLIVQEFPVDASGCRQPPVSFGAVTAQPTGKARTDANCPTIYLLSSEATIGGSRFKQSTYLWFYPPDSPGGRLRCRGVRTTIGSRGHVIIWEILYSDTELQEIYVSEPVEKAARGQYGPPLAGRRFSVEPALGEYPDVVVPRVVADGPQPLGPFVYLDAGLAVATVICRCEPSQVEEFPSSGHYQLERVEDLSAVLDGRTPPGNLALLRNAARVERCLRLPGEL
jgi:hypothetical protein